MELYGYVFVWFIVRVCVFIFIMVYYIKSTSFIEEATKTSKIHVKNIIFADKNVRMKNEAHYFSTIKNLMNRGFITYRFIFER